MNQAKQVVLETSMVRHRECAYFNTYRTHSLHHVFNKASPVFSCLLYILMLEYIVLQGDVSVELYWNHAPKTCRNFAELVIFLV